ncbi:MAG: serine acetyltransferase [Planctomycetaceae bacterium]|nr:serine acetyltransferase [Planctomycetaceae bacterium]
MATDYRRKEQLTVLTDRIVDSYQEIGSINHLGHCPLPSSQEIVTVIHDLTEILYPGYRRRQNLHPGNVAYYVGDIIDGLHDRLTQQITRVLRYEHDRTHGLRCHQECDVDFEARSQELAIDFLECLPQLREVLALDVQAAYEGDPAARSTDEIIFCYPGLEAITVHRLAHELHRRDVPIIPRIMSEWVHSRTGIDIHPGAQIGPSFFIDHGTGVVIGETTEIAANVKIYQGVTLGALSFAKDANGKLIRNRKRHPTIEQGVVIYSNASVLGGETIVGACSVIGAGVSLTRSIDPHTVVTVDKPSLRFREAG